MAALTNQMTSCVQTMSRNNQTMDLADSESDGLHVKVTLSVSGDADANPLGVIRGISSGVPALDAPLRDAVAKARQQRRTWEEIGDALGTTRQSAWNVSPPTDW